VQGTNQSVSLLSNALYTSCSPFFTQLIPFYRISTLLLIHPLLCFLVPSLRCLRRQVVGQISHTRRYPRRCSTQGSHTGATPQRKLASPFRKTKKCLSLHTDQQNPRHHVCQSKGSGEGARGGVRQRPVHRRLRHCRLSPEALLLLRRGAPL
jgi:hypothetical protein